MSLPWTELFPSLRTLERTAIELDPQPAPDTPVDASRLGGAVLWPSSMEWPRRPEGDPFIPLLQLRREDFPEVPFPPGRDVLQILWHPQFTERRPIGFLAPATRFYWWTLQTNLNEAQAASHEPSPGAHPGLVPKACRLSPRRRPDLPGFADLPGRLQAQLAERDLVNEYRRSGACSRASKLLGHPAWQRNAVQLRCSSCGRPMIHFLTLASEPATGLDFYGGGTGHFLMCSACERRPVTLLIESE
jgi:hypothetical protein